jgi:polar amino acid transport system substrate-binding protein
MHLVRLAALILFPFMCHAQSGTQLRLATLEYPPYSSEHLSGGGSLVELTRRAFAVEGHEVQIDFRPWPRVRLALRNGTYQGALALWPREIKAYNPHAHCFTANWGCSCAETQARCALPS